MKPAGPPMSDPAALAVRVAARWLCDSLDLLPHPDVDVLRDYTPDADVAARAQACVPDVIAAVRRHLRDLCPSTPDSEEADHG